MLPELDDWSEDSIQYREGEGNGIGVCLLLLIAMICFLVAGAAIKGCL